MEHRSRIITSQHLFFHLLAMRVFGWLVLFYCLVGCPLPSSAQTDFVIREIRFNGNQTFPARILKERMVSFSTRRLQNLLFLKKPFLFNEEILKNDVQRLQHFYQSEGFVDVVIRYHLVSNPKKHTIRITLDIKEGQYVRVRQVEYTFPTEQQPSEEDSARAMIAQLAPALKSGIRFRDQALRADQEKMNKHFSNSGYPYFRVQPQLTVVRENHFVDVAYQVETGPRCLVGDIDVLENQRTPAALIRKQLSFRSGDLFQQDLVEKSQLQVYQLGFFQTVTIRSLMGSSPISHIPVQVVVREAPRFTVKFGIGYGKEDNVRVFSDLRFLSFFGGARRFNLVVRHSGLEPYNLNLKMTQPAFPFPKTSLLVNSFFRREDEPGFSVVRIGGNLSLQQQLALNTSGQISYNLEQDNLGLSLAATDLQSQSPDIKLYRKSSLGIGLIRDSSRPLFYPNQGAFAALSYTVTVPIFSNEFHYTRWLFEVRRYWSLGKSSVLAVKTKLGAMQSIRGDKVTPIEERFFAGGSMSIRGWSRGQISPENSLGDPIGGNSYFEGSVEVRFPIWRFISAVGFLDFGNVWRESWYYDFAHLRYAAGPGLRVQTPIGPVRLDLARPVFDKDKFIRIHVSVGQAF